MVLLLVMLLSIDQSKDVELALVSIACIDKHIFTFYGSAHKSNHSGEAVLLDAFFMAHLLNTNVPK